jgi:hypothetical protein
MNPGVNTRETDLKVEVLSRVNISETVFIFSKWRSDELVIQQFAQSEKRERRRFYKQAQIVQN